MAAGFDFSVIEFAVEHRVDTPIIAKTLEHSSTPTSAGTTVLDPVHITTDFDLLLFGAAAYDQLFVIRSGSTGGSKGVNSREAQHLSSFLVSSPYNNPGHYLDLQSLDKANLIFSGQPDPITLLPVTLTL
jgi:hypothetical protein